MNCQQLQESFLDHQAGALDDATARAMRDHLGSCLTCQRHWADLQQTLLALEALPTPEPSSRLRTNFNAMIDEAQRELDSPTPFALARNRIDAFFAALLPHRPTLQFAFSLGLLLLGVLVGTRWIPTPRPVEVPSDNTRAELAALQAKVDSMDRIVTTALRQQSATARLQGVLAASASGTTDDHTLAELLNTLAFDASVNVRLFALEALYAHVERDPVRAAVIAGLPRESSPLVQVAMIDFIVASGDPATANALTALSQDTQVHAVVREAAQQGLAQL